MSSTPLQVDYEAGEMLPPTSDKQPPSVNIIQEMQEKPLLPPSGSPPGFIELHASTYSIFWIIFFRTLTILILVGCLTLGAKEQVFSLGDQTNITIMSRVFDLSVDAQLAVFGLVNKVLDYLVQDALLHIGGITLTAWMAFTKTGANTMDYEMTDEMTMPWITVRNIVRRFKLFGWQGVRVFGLFRYFASLATSMMVLLLGASVNTIAIPKERWSTGTDLWTDRYQISSIEWGGVDNIAWNMGFSFDGIYNRSLSIMATQIWMVTSGLWMATNSGVPLDGWVEVYQDKNGAWNKTSDSRVEVKRVTGVRVNSTAASSMSLQGNLVYDLWVSQTQHGSINAQRSLGCSGSFNLTLPIGLVSCTEGTTDISTETITVAGPDSHGAASIIIVIGPSTVKSFPGATCTFTLRQGQYGVSSWIIDQSQPDISIDAYGADRYINITYHEPEAAQNRDIMVQIANIFRDTIPIMNSLSFNGLVQHMLSVSSGLIKTDQNSSNSTAGLAMIVAGMLQHIITMAEWDMVEMDPGKDLVRSTDVRYQVYGSGPRLRWEWAIATILVIGILMLIYDIYLTLKERVNVGQWLSLAGMMVTANYSEKIASLNDGSENKTVQKTSYFIRKMDSGNCHITDDRDSGTILSRNDGFGGGKTLDC